MSKDLQTNLGHFMMINYDKYDSFLHCHFADIFLCNAHGSKRVEVLTSHYSFSSCKNISCLFSKMFADNQIAQSFSCGAKK